MQDGIYPASRSHRHSESRRKEQPVLPYGLQAVERLRKHRRSSLRFTKDLLGLKHSSTNPILGRQVPS